MLVVPRQPHVYDVAEILGLPRLAAPVRPLLPAPDETLLVTPSGLSLDALHRCAAGRRLLHRQDWYVRQPWAGRPVPPGTYRVRARVHGSEGLAAVSQEALLGDGEVPAPTALLVAAILCHHLVTGEDLLAGGWARCAEPCGVRTEVTWVGGMVTLLDHAWHVECDWWEDPHRDVWAAACRRAD